MRRVGIKYGDLDQVRRGKQLEAKAKAELEASARLRPEQTRWRSSKEQPD